MSLRGCGSIVNKVIPKLGQGVVDPGLCMGWICTWLEKGRWGCGVSRGVACDITLLLFPVADDDCSA